MELLPCPFCGSNNLGQTEYRFSSEIYCHECNGSCDSEIWNTRHSPWISVFERLPDHNNPVLISTKENYGFDYNVSYLHRNDLGNNWHDQQGIRIEKYKVTHWMPLPQPPKEIK